MVISAEFTPSEGYASALKLAGNGGVEDELSASIRYPRVKLSTVDGSFTVACEDGSEEQLKELRGIILFGHPDYAYYENNYAGGHAAPDCSSRDGVIGYGIPGGSCAECEFNKWGSGGGRSKKCKNRRMIYVLRAGETVPVALSVPVGSVAGYKAYLKNLAKTGRTPAMVESSITLTKALTQSGVPYAKLDFLPVRTLDENEESMAKQFAAQVVNYIDSLNAIERNGGFEYGF